MAFQFLFKQATADVITNMQHISLSKKLSVDIQQVTNKSKRHFLKRSYEVKQHKANRQT